MITISRQGKTLFFDSSRHGAPLAYYVLQFRGRINLNKLSILRVIFRRAQVLENKMPELSKYARLLWEAKKAVYSIRCDLERPIDSVIHPIMEETASTSIGYAINLLLNGQGISLYSKKQVKPITCKEKRVKVLKRFTELLAMRFA